MEPFPSRRCVVECPPGVSGGAQNPGILPMPLDGALPIRKIHDVTGALEDRVKEKFPLIARVTIHPEPVEER
jgi:hypothetical protein